MPFDLNKHNNVKHTTEFKKLENFNKQLHKQNNKLKHLCLLDFPAYRTKQNHKQLTNQITNKSQAKRRRKGSREEKG